MSTNLLASKEAKDKKVKDAFERRRRIAAKVKPSYNIVGINIEYAIIAIIDANVLKSDAPSVTWSKGSKHHPANISVRDVIDAIRARDSSTDATICYDTGFNDKKVANIIRELKRQGIVMKC